MRYMFKVFIIYLSLFISCANAASSDFASRPDVKAFILLMVKKHHFDQKYLTTLFDKVKVRPQIMRQMNKPLEKEPWNFYQRLFISEWRIKHGVEFWNKYANVLKQAEQKFGVPASIIVATIGIETKYGQRTGEHRVIDSLSNIAFSNSPRAKFFRSELEEFLLLTREQHLDPLKVTGSYAGAIGQPQFMPSSYRHYAVNFSGSGQTDLMHNEVDVIGSIANYYKKAGWKMNQPVAVPAVMMKSRYNFAQSHKKANGQLTIGQWQRYGIMPKYPISNDDMRAKVIELQNRYTTEYWLGFHNFDVIKRYNPSDLYAMAVYQLSTYITNLKDQSHHG